MEVNIKVEIQDEEYCDGCSHFQHCFGYAYCLLFDTYLVRGRTMRFGAYRKLNQCLKQFKFKARKGGKDVSSNTSSSRR
jgi:hypothetical protein